MSDRLHRLELRAPGDPRRLTIHLDGVPITFVSRVEFVLDCNGGGEVKLTVPAACVDLDVDVATFVTAHTDGSRRKPDEIHAPTPDGPIEHIAITYKRNADGTADGIDTKWGPRIAAAAARIVSVDTEDLPLAERAWLAVKAKHQPDS